jgi:hypothetical protein
MDAETLKQLLEERLKSFKFKYIGGGYFRDKDIKVGKRADILHGDEVLASFCKYILEQTEGD